MARNVKPAGNHHAGEVQVALLTPGVNNTVNSKVNAMKKLLTAFLLMVFGIGNAQNLVTNPGFENYDSLPCGFSISAAYFSSLIQNWTVPNYTTPDVISPLISPTCLYGNPLSSGSGGLQTPRTGNIMIGMVCENGGYNEPIQVPLTTPLIIGNSYQAEMYVSLAARSDFANNNIGMYFSDTLIFDSTYLSTNYLPQILDTTTITDTVNWVLISGCFTATSAAQYLIIGNFVSPCQHSVLLLGGWPMAYYFFDDISVTQIPPCTSGQLNCPLGIAENENKKLKIYPNPVSDFLTMENAASGGTIEIKNLFGTILLTQEITSDKSLLNLQALPGGLYVGYYRENKHQEVFKFIKQ